MNPARIIALWYEPGTIYDAAQAAYNVSGIKISPEKVREIWMKAQADGDLPPFERPSNGFNKDQAIILKRFMMIEKEKRAA